MLIIGFDCGVEFVAETSGFSLCIPAFELFVAEGSHELFLAGLGGSDQNDLAVFSPVEAVVDCGEFITPFPIELCLLFSS